MNYTYLTEDQRISIARDELRAMEANIFRQELLVAQENLVQAHKDKLAAQISAYNKLEAVAPKKSVSDEPISPAA